MKFYLPLISILLLCACISSDYLIEQEHKESAKSSKKVWVKTPRYCNDQIELTLEEAVHILNKNHIRVYGSTKDATNSLTGGGCVTYYAYIGKSMFERAKSLEWTQTELPARLERFVEYHD